MHSENLANVCKVAGYLDLTFRELNETTLFVPNETEQWSLVVPITLDVKLVLNAALLYIHGFTVNLMCL